MYYPPVVNSTDLYHPLQLLNTDKILLTRDTVRIIVKLIKLLTYYMNLRPFFFLCKNLKYFCKFRLYSKLSVSLSHSFSFSLSLVVFVCVCVWYVLFCFFMFVFKNCLRLVVDDGDTWWLFYCFLTFSFVSSALVARIRVATRTLTAGVSRFFLFRTTRVWTNTRHRCRGRNGIPRRR